VCPETPTENGGLEKLSGLLGNGFARFAGSGEAQFYFRRVSGKREFYSRRAVSTFCYHDDMARKSAAQLNREIAEALAQGQPTRARHHAMKKYIPGKVQGPRSKNVAMAPGTYVVVGEAPTWKAFTLHADGRVDFVDAKDGHVSVWNIHTWGEGDRWLADRAKELAAGDLRKRANR